MIHYNTPAAKYTGALQGDYTDDLPPATSEYTKMIDSILNESVLPFPETAILKSIYALYGGEIDLDPPTSRLNAIIQFGVYPDRFTVENVSETEMTVYDRETGAEKVVHLGDNLEKIWAKIVSESGSSTGYGVLISKDGFSLVSSDGYTLYCKITTNTQKEEN